MIERLEIKLRGSSPLLMHKFNGDSPSEPKRSAKTQAYIDERHRKDWMQSAYFSEKLGFFIPGEVVDGALVGGAKRNRRGMDFKTFCFCEELEVPLIYYEDADDKKGKFLHGKLADFYLPGFSDLRAVVIKGSRIDRCRPIFRNWGLHFHLQYDGDFLQLEDIQNALKYGAIGDFRPRFGRFQVEHLQQLKLAA